EGLPKIGDHRTVLVVPVDHLQPGSGGPPLEPDACVVEHLDQHPPAAALLAQDPIAELRPAEELPGRTDDLELPPLLQAVCVVRRHPLLLGLLLRADTLGLCPNGSYRSR